MRPRMAIVPGMASTATAVAMAMAMAAMVGVMRTIIVIQMAPTMTRKRPRTAGIASTATAVGMALAMARASLPSALAYPITRFDRYIASGFAIISQRA